jgi:hypothetical protein
MNLLTLKLILTPTLIGLASLAGRKWGHAVSGWIVALPLTAGPIVFFLALSHDAAFAAETAGGILMGCLSLVVFTIVYSRLALRFGWLPTLAVSSVSFFAMTALLGTARIGLVVLWPLVLLCLFIAYRLLPTARLTSSAAQELPGWWDIPLRMLIATGFVLAITWLAPLIGPHLAGLLVPFPLFTATLAAFAQHQYGGAAALSVLQGMLLGLFSYASFMFTLAMALVPAGMLAAFGMAILVVVVLQGVALRLVWKGIH